MKSLGVTLTFQWRLGIFRFSDHSDLLALFIEMYDVIVNVGYTVNSLISI